jgi:hypothetical protein
MPSPFPGMDPWLEAPDLFPALHERMTVAITDALNAAMPPGYVATLKHSVWVDPELRREPDVALYGRNFPPESEGGISTLPGMLALGRKRKSDPIEEPYLEIVSDRGKRLVTAVEVISVTNKRAGRQGRESYQQKQEEYALGRVNLVEIDLLRRGPHVGVVPLPRLRRRLGAFDYHVSALLAGKSPTYHAAGFRLTDPLPTVSIPLDAGVPPVPVALQPMLDAAYDRARYHELFSYADPPDPPLTPEQQAWAEGFLREKGLLA